MNYLTIKKIMLYKENYKLYKIKTTAHNKSVPKPMCLTNQ